MQTITSFKKLLWGPQSYNAKPSKSDVNNALGTLQKFEPKLLSVAVDWANVPNKLSVSLSVVEDSLMRIIKHNRLTKPQYWTLPNVPSEHFSSYTSFVMNQKYSDLVANACGQGGFSYATDCSEYHYILSTQGKSIPDEIYWKGLAILTISDPFPGAMNRLFYEEPNSCLSYIEWAGNRDDIEDIVEVTSTSSTIDTAHLAKILDLRKSHHPSLSKGTL